MRVLLATAALLAAVAVSALPAAPAEAQSSGRSGFNSDRGAQSFQGSGRHRDGRRDRRRDRRFGDTIVLDTDFDGGSAWRHDSFNDWWHERPHRAYPKWVTSGTCDRAYWAGGGWRC